MGISDHLTCLLKIVYAGQEVTEPDMKQQTGSKFGKECVKAVYCHPAYLTLYAECIIRNASLDEAQAGIKISWRNINNLRYAYDYGRKQRGTKEPLEKSEKAGLKLNIHMGVPMADKDPYSQSYGQNSCTEVRIGP